MCHYGNDWCRDQSDTTHECPRKPTNWAATGADILLSGYGFTFQDSAIGIGASHAPEKRVVWLVKEIPVFGTMSDERAIEQAKADAALHDWASAEVEHEDAA